MQLYVNERCAFFLFIVLYCIPTNHPIIGLSSLWRAACDANKVDAISVARAVWQVVPKMCTFYL